MKKFIYSSILLFISAFSFGQSTTITPSRVENNSFTNNNFKVESSHSFLGFSAIRFNPTLSIVKNPVLSGNTILTLGGGGYYNTTDDIHFSKARISFIATENYSATAAGSKISFLTTPNGSTTTTERMSIDHNGNVMVSGFTTLGNDATAPRIKMKKLTGTTNAAQGGSTTIAHGIANLSKIISINVLVAYNGSFADAYVANGYTSAAGYEFDYQIDGDIIVTNKTGNSANILSKNIKVVITYEE